MNMPSRIGVGLVLFWLAGCQTLPTGPASSPPATVPPAESLAVHWFRDSAEQKAAYEQAYRLAGQVLAARAAGKAPGSWGVILDIDETILDNSDYQKQQELAGKGFDVASWTTWVQSERATVLPGARAFIDSVKDDLHGQVVLVTNRGEGVCQATRENLEKVQLWFDRVLCDAVGDGNKNPRFHLVQEGADGAAPLLVLMWIGDNIRDFPELSQESTDWSGFGSRFFVLPDPMYGSWVTRPRR